MKAVPDMLRFGGVEFCSVTGAGGGGRLEGGTMDAELEESDSGGDGVGCWATPYLDAEDSLCKKQVTKYMLSVIKILHKGKKSIKY